MGNRGIWGAVLAVMVAVVPVRLAAADDNGINELIARIDRLWIEREQPGAIQDMLALGTVAQAVDPHSYEVQWRITRAVFWIARTQSNRITKGSMATRARDLAVQAIELAPTRAEGHYFLAVALGEYATTTGIVRAVREGLAGRIEDAGHKAYEIDRDFDNGAPITVLGRFYFMLPWPKRDLDRSRQLLEELRERHPDSLAGRYYLAETYHALDQDDAARRELEYVINAEAKTIDLDHPQVLAQAALREWFVQ